MAREELRTGSKCVCLLVLLGPLALEAEGLVKMRVLVFVAWSCELSLFVATVSCHFELSLCFVTWNGHFELSLRAVNVSCRLELSLSVVTLSCHFEWSL